MSTTILVVDDDPNLREVVRYALSREGFRVEEAQNGEEALRRWRALKPDLLVLDVLMPEMDGLAVCREIRRESTVPIVFLSSRDEELDRVLGLELGGDDYISKPFSTRELVSRVQRSVWHRFVLVGLRGSPAGPLAAISWVAPPAHALRPRAGGRGRLDRCEGGTANRGGRARRGWTWRSWPRRWGSWLDGDSRSAPWGPGRWTPSRRHCASSRSPCRRTCL